MPFLRLFSSSDRFAYFKGLKSFLCGHGFLVFTPMLPWGSSLEKRARELHRKIQEITRGFTKYKKVHLIGHSMGGLDIRLMFHAYRMQERILSITTIGTPHLGTSLADMKTKPLLPIIVFLRRLGLDLTGFFDLTTERQRALNRELRGYEKDSGVLIRTIAGRQPLRHIFCPLRHSYRLLQEIEGENDGLVSVASAGWDDRYLLEVWELDHLNQIGWWHPSEPLGREAFYEKVNGLYLKILRDLPE